MRNSSKSPRRQKYAAKLSMGFPLPPEEMEDVIPSRLVSRLRREISRNEKVNCPSFPSNQGLCAKERNRQLGKLTTLKLDSPRRLASNSPHSADRDEIDFHPFMQQKDIENNYYRGSTLINHAKMRHILRRASPHSPRSPTTSRTPKIPRNTLELNNSKLFPKISQDTMQRQKLRHLIVACKRITKDKKMHTRSSNNLHTFNSQQKLLNYTSREENHQFLGHCPLFLRNKYEAEVPTFKIALFSTNEEDNNKNLNESNWKKEKLTIDNKTYYNQRSSFLGKFVSFSDKLQKISFDKKRRSISNKSKIEEAQRTIAQAEQIKHLEKIKELSRESCKSTRLSHKNFLEYIQEGLDEDEEQLALMYNRRGRTNSDIDQMFQRTIGVIQNNEEGNIHDSKVNYIKKSMTMKRGSIVGGLRTSFSGVTAKALASNLGSNMGSSRTLSKFAQS